jgi:hypothetical protein
MSAQQGNEGSRSGEDSFGHETLEASCLRGKDPQKGQGSLSSRLQSHLTRSWTKNRNGLLDLNLRELDIAGVGKGSRFRLGGGNGEAGSDDGKLGLCVQCLSGCSKFSAVDDTE